MTDIVPGDSPLKLGFGHQFEHLLEHRLNAEQLVKGEQDTSNLWHEVTSQLIMLPPVVDCDTVPTKARDMEAQVTIALDCCNNGGYHTCGVGWIVTPEWIAVILQIT